MDDVQTVARYYVSDYEGGAEPDPVNGQYFTYDDYASLAKRVRELEADAARYRWLRRQN